MTDATTIEAAREAWARLRERQAASWSDWITVGHALVAGRAAAMKAAKCNRPYGRKYSAQMRAWLDRYELAEISPQERNVLLRVVENLPAISAWRDELDGRVRQRINHPGAAWWAWRRSTGTMSTHQAASRWGKQIPLGLDQAQLSRAANAVFDCLRRGVNDATIIATCALRAACMPPRIRPSRQRQREAEMRAAL
jgi:hypothetical protein